MSAKKAFVRFTEAIGIRFLLKKALSFFLRIAHSEDVAKEVMKAGEFMPSHHFVKMVTGWSLTLPMADCKHNIKMRIRTPMDVVRVRAISKEPWTADWIYKNVKESEVFYDIGANVGAYSLLAAAQGGATGKVYSFEPSASTFGTLCENIQVNNFGERITPMQFALSDGMNAVHFAYQSLDSGSALHSIEQIGSDSKASFNQPILTQSLDSLRKTYDMPYPHHLKIDVDGHEMEVLSGMANILTNRTLKTIMAEVDKDEKGVEVPIAKVLEQYDFKETERFKREYSDDDVIPPEYVIFKRA